MGGVGWGWVGVGGGGWVGGGVGGNLLLERVHELLLRLRLLRRLLHLLVLGLELLLALLELGEHARDHDLHRHLELVRVILRHAVVDRARLRVLLALLLLRRGLLALHRVFRRLADALAEGESLPVVQPVGRRLDDLEGLVRQRVVWILVRVDLHRHAAVGLLDGVGGRRSSRARAPRTGSC